MSNVEQKSESESEENKIDPTIDITSEHFDPLKALYSENIILPYKKAKVFDNISKFESTVLRPKTSSNEPTTSNTTTDSMSILSDTRTKAATNNRNKFSVSNEPITRRFLPHQQMVKGYRKEKHSRNILKKIDKGFGGPVDMLKVYMENRNRIKIYTRKEHGILGHITGFVESFDKHWNVVLSDVCEVWKRKKIYFCDAANHGSPEDCSQKLKKLKIQFPQVHIKSLSRKYVECTRKVPQLMVRGEQVAVIMLDIPTNTNLDKNVKNN